MASFSVAYPVVARAEGGYQNHPNDSGNYNSLGQLVGTNWGISAPTFESWIGRPPTTAEMKAITQDTAKNILKAKFWDPIKGDQIVDQDVATIFLDGHVNHGRTGIKLMQQVLGVAADGIVGPITLGKLNKAKPATVYTAYKEIRRKFYNQLATSKPSLAVFLKGWLARLDSFTAYAAAGGLALGGIAAGIFLLFITRKKS